MRMVYVVLISLAAVGISARSTAAEALDLKGLAKKARPCVLMLVVSDTRGKEVATGSGFCVSADGKLITNRHVVENGASAVAKAENGAVFLVEGLLGVSEANDLALLKLKGKDLPFLEVGRTDGIEVGTRVAVIGSPLGLEGTLTDGIVSAVRKESVGPEKWIQITAPISTGSSGSPVLDPQGQVVGVATLLMRGGQGLNFAVAAEAVQELMKSAQKSAEVKSFNAVFKQRGQELWRDADFRAFHVAKRAQDHPEASAMIKRVLQRYPENSEAYYWLGELEWEKSGLRGDLTRGESAYRRAVELKPDYFEAWDQLGLVYQMQDKLPEAATALLTAVKVRPDYWISWLRLGHVYKEQHAYTKAAEAYQKAVGLDPKNETAWCGLGTVLEKQKKFREALAAYEQAFGLAPKKGDIFDMIEMEESLYGMAVCHFRLGETNKAEAYRLRMEATDSKRAEELRVLFQGR